MMLRSQTALVIAKVIAHDARLAKSDDKAREAMVEAWHEVIGDLRFEDCKAAVTAFYRDGGGWIDASAVRQRVQSVRLARRAAVPVPELPAEVADRPRVYAAAIAAATAAIMDGEDQAGALVAAAAAATVAAERDSPRELAP